MITITRKLTFDSGHRVFRHESRCANLHGHTYKVFITATAHTLDSIGRVIDFSVLKEKFGKWIEDNWDHGFLWCEDDPVCQHLFETKSAWNDASTMKNFKCPFNPTAENMANFLLRDIAPMMFVDTGITIISIELHETENCKAIVTL